MKVYFFCSHTVPTEHPNGVRFANLGQIFRELGYDVYFVGCDNKDEREFQFKGMCCNVFHQENSQGLKAVIQREADRKNKIQTFIEKNGKPDVVVSGYFDCSTQRFLKKYCRKYGVIMIESVCEWFDRNNYAGLSGIIKYISNRYSMYIQFPQIKNIIAISSLLDQYYRSKGCHTVTIPTNVDIDEYEDLNHHIHDRIHIAYAGSPAKKDYILNAIHALALLSEEERAKIELHLYGPEVRQLQSLGLSDELLKICGDSLICHGRIPYSEVKSRIADADFTVLLRPNARYANAGFPTKVGESMACGTPVIANHTSDLHKYIRDGETGIVAQNESAEACANAFRKAIHLSHSERAMMRKMALKEANSSFNYLSYVEPMRRFIEECHQYD